MSAPLATSSPALHRQFFISSKPSGSGHPPTQLPLNRSGARGLVEEPTVDASSTNAKIPSKTKAGLKRHDESRLTTMKKEKGLAFRKDSTMICLPATEAWTGKLSLISKKPKKTFHQASKSYNDVDMSFASSRSSQKQAATEGCEKVGVESERHSKRKPSRSSSIDSFSLQASSLPGEARAFNSAPGSAQRAMRHQVDRKEIGKTSVASRRVEIDHGKQAPSTLPRLSDGDHAVSKRSSVPSNLSSHPLMPPRRVVTVKPCANLKNLQPSQTLRNPPSGPILSLWRPSVLATHPPQSQSAVAKAATPYKVFFSNGVKVTILSDTYKVCPFMNSVGKLNIFRC
jgi:hypothetical protein